MGHSLHLIIALDCVYPASFWQDACKQDGRIANGRAYLQYAPGLYYPSQYNQQLSDLRRNNGYMMLLGILLQLA